MACKDLHCAEMRAIYKDTIEGLKQGSAAWKSVADMLRQRVAELEEENELLRGALQRPLVWQKPTTPEEVDELVESKRNAS